MELKDLQAEWEEKSEVLSENGIYSFLDIFPKLCRKAQEMIYDAMSILHIKTYPFTWECEELITMTPIEQIYFIAFIIYYEIIKSKFMVFLDSQVEIISNEKKYRVDFLIKDFFGKSKLSKLKKPIIIECDGYDFHSTKNQRNSDTERENDLKMLGYPIIRFTGSQIYKDPYLCVMQTIKFLYDENEEQLSKYFEVK